MPANSKSIAGRARSYMTAISFLTLSDLMLHSSAQSHGCAPKRCNQCNRGSRISNLNNWGSPLKLNLFGRYRIFGTGLAM